MILTSDLIGFSYSAYRFAAMLYPIFCLFPTKQDPSWRYLVGADGKTLTADSKPLALVPKVGAKSGEVCAPREREVASGTLIKMYGIAISSIGQLKRWAGLAVGSKSKMVREPEGFTVQ